MDDDFFTAATQAIPLSDFDDGADDGEENEVQPKMLCATLRVKKKEGFSETEFPIYEGTNIIGRGEGTDVHIPLKALSRAHACIDVIAGSHVIYDKGSRNKTRRLKLALTPEVRYELRDGDILTFGDVECVYMFTPPPQAKGDVAGSETGSETGSQSMLIEDVEKTVAGTGSETMSPSVLIEDVEKTVAGTGTGQVAAIGVAPNQEEEILSDASIELIEPSQNGNNGTKLATRMVMVPDSGSDGETPGNRTQGAGENTLALVLDESNLTLEADATNTSLEPTIVYQIDKEPDNDDMMATQAYTLEPEKEAHKSDVKPAVSKKTQRHEVSEGVAYDMDVEDETPDDKISADSGVTQSFMENVVDANNMPPILNLGISSTLAFDDDFTVARQETGGFKAGSDTDVVQDNDMPTQVFPDKEGGTLELGEGVTQVLEVPETQVDGEQLSEVGETQGLDVGDKQVLAAGETLVLGAGERQVLGDGETQVLEVVETQVLEAGETQVLEAGETQVLEAGETQVLQGEEIQILEVKETQVSGLVTDDEASSRLTDKDVNALTNQTVNRLSEEATQVFAATVQVHGFNDANTSSPERVCNTRHVEESPSPKKKVMWAMETQVFMDDDVTDDEILQASTSSVTPAHRMLSRTARVLLKSSEDAQVLEDDCYATQLLDDSCASITVDETPAKNPQSAKKPENIASPLVATQVFIGEETQVESDDVGLSLLLDNTCPFIEVDNTAFHSPASKETRTSDMFEATQVYKADCDETQLMDDTCMVQATRFIKPSDSEKANEAAVNEETQAYVGNVGAGLIETLVRKKETFIHPDEVATQAYAIASDTDDEKSGNESEDIDFDVPMPILSSTAKAVKSVEEPRGIPDDAVCGAPKYGTSDTAETQAYDMEDLDESSEEVEGRAGDTEATQAYAVSEDVEEDEVDEMVKDPPAGTSRNQMAETAALLRSPGTSDDVVMRLEENTHAKGKQGQPSKVVSMEEQKHSPPDESLVKLDHVVMSSPSVKGMHKYLGMTANSSQENARTTSEDPKEVSPSLTLRVMAKPGKAENNEQRWRGSGVFESVSDGDHKRKLQEVELDQPAKRRQVVPGSVEQVEVKDTPDDGNDIQVVVREKGRGKGPECLVMEKSGSVRSVDQQQEASKEDDRDVNKEATVKKNVEYMVAPPQGRGRRTAKQQPKSTAGHDAKAKEKRKQEPTTETNAKKHVLDEDMGGDTAAAAPTMAVGKDGNRTVRTSKRKSQDKIPAQTEPDQSEKRNIKEQNFEEAPHFTRKNQASQMPAKEFEESKVKLKNKTKTVKGRGRPRKGLKTADGEGVSISSGTSVVHDVDGADRRRSRSKDSKAEIADIEPCRSNKTRGAQKCCVGGKAKTVQDVDSSSSGSPARATHGRCRVEVVNDSTVTVESTSSEPPLAKRTSRSHSPKEAQLLTEGKKPVRGKYREKKDVKVSDDKVSHTSSVPAGAKRKTCERAVQPVLSQSVKGKNRSTRNTRGRCSVVFLAEGTDEDTKNSVLHDRYVGDASEKVDHKALVCTDEVAENSGIKGRKDRGRSSIVKSESMSEMALVASEDISFKFRRGDRGMALPLKFEMATENASIASEDVTSKPRRGSRGKALPLKLETVLVAETASVASEDILSMPRRGSRGRALSLKLKSATETTLVGETAAVASEDVSSKPKRGSRGKRLPLKLETILVAETASVASKDVSSKPRRGSRGKAQPVKLESTTETASLVETSLLASKDVSSKPRRSSRGKALAVKSETKELVPVAETALVASKDVSSKSQRCGRRTASPVISQSAIETTSVAKTVSVASEDVSSKPWRGGRGKPLGVKTEPATQAGSVATSDHFSQSTHGKGKPVTTLQKCRSQTSVSPVASTSKNMKAQSEGKLQTDTVHSLQKQSMKRRHSTDRQASNVSGQPMLKRSRIVLKQVDVPVTSHSLGTHTKKPRVMFTGVIDEKGQKILKDLGGELADNIFECSHLITDKVRRTVKFLCGLARGISIVNTSWLDACRKAQGFVDVAPHLVVDAEAEKSHKFKLMTSIEKAAIRPMLQGYSLHITKSVKPDPKQMKEIIKCAGGEFLVSMPRVPAERTLVVSCISDERLLKGALLAGVSVVSPEFILTGILRQEVDLQTYRLFPPGPQPKNKNRRK